MPNGLIVVLNPACVRQLPIFSVKQDPVNKILSRCVIEKEDDGIGILVLNSMCMNIPAKISKIQILERYLLSFIYAKIEIFNMYAFTAGFFLL